MNMSSKKLNSTIIYFGTQRENLSISENSWKNEVPTFLQMRIEKFVYLFDKKIFTKYLFEIIFDKCFLMSFE